jgi:hypothetical protein
MLHPRRRPRRIRQGMSCRGRERRSQRHGPEFRYADAEREVLQNERLGCSEARGELEQKDHSCFRRSASALTAASASKGLIEEAPVKAFLHLHTSSLVQNQKPRRAGNRSPSWSRVSRALFPVRMGAGRAIRGVSRAGNRLRDKL